jgi:IgA peptidase. Metallo peptidase. MEROPS family M64
MKSIHDQAASVPYDQLYVLVNSTRYGGGGFYNFLNLTTVDHALSPKVFIHEFGHGFAGLGDEYYNSEVAYENYYNLEVEPWEPNLTTLVNFASKWKDLVDKSTPMPTPRTADYTGKVGVFEGGGYMTKGIYSPAEDCRMKSNAPQDFCPVCQRAIRETILLNTK